MSTPFLNEILSLQIDPPRGQKAKCITYGLYENGVVTVIESEPYSQNEKALASAAFLITDPKEVASLKTLGRDWAERLKNAPRDTNLPDFSGSEFHLSMRGISMSGSYFLADLEKSAQNPNMTPLELKNLEWNNKIVGLAQAVLSHLESLSTSLRPLDHRVPELDYLRPVSRYLIFLMKTDAAHFFLPVSTKEEAIKAAAKKVFANKNYPSGDVFSACFSLLDHEALRILIASVDRKNFDLRHPSLVRELLIASKGTLSFAEAAYWLDMSYAYFLLVPSCIVSETKVSFLHVPARKEDLTQEMAGDEEAAYVFYEKAGREEWEPLRISPIYFYFESLFVRAHPKEKEEIHAA